MSAATSIRIHIRNQVDITALQQLLGQRVVDIQQHIDAAFHPPFRHGFPWVLARDNPALSSFSFPGFAYIKAKAQEVQVLPIQRLAEESIATVLGRLRLGDELMMSFHGIRREIGEVHRVLFWAKFYSKAAVIQAGVVSVPVFTVIGITNPVVSEAIGIGCPVSVNNSHYAALLSGIAETKIKPLIER